MVHTASHVFYVPQSPVNLLSAGLMKTRASLILDMHTNQIVDRYSRKTFGEVEERGELFHSLTNYVEDAGRSPPNDKPTRKTDLHGRSAKAIPTETWHRRLGHLGHDNLRRLTKVAKGIELLTSSPSDCETCKVTNTKRKPFGDAPRAKREGEVLHLDFVTPIRPRGYDGSRGYISFTDDFSCAMSAGLLKKKSDGLQPLKNHCAQLKARGKPVLAIRSDGESILRSHDAENWMGEQGIQWWPTVPAHPESNGLAEVNQHVLNLRATAMLHDAGLPLFLWPLALQHAIYLRNRSPIERLGFTTPIERITNRKPDLSHLRIFGSTVYYHIPKQKRVQSEHFTPHGKKGILVGFDPISTKTVKIWILGTRQVIVETSDKYDGEDPTDDMYEEDLGPPVWSLTDSV
jgi:GAG-pre-integrase domain